MKLTALATAVITGALLLSSSASAAALDAAGIEQITGLKGTQNGTVFKVTAPRNDVAVQVDGWKMPPHGPDLLGRLFSGRQG